jgi:hypothetical protein
MDQKTARKPAHFNENRRNLSPVLENHPVKFDF